MTEFSLDACTVSNHFFRFNKSHLYFFNYLTKKDKAAEVPEGSREDILEERAGCEAP